MDITVTNFAPTASLTRVNDNDRAYEDSDLHSFAREVFVGIRERNRRERREIVESARLMAGLRSGKMILKREPIYGNLALLPRLPQKNNQDAHIYPLAQVNSSQLTSIWSLARPKTLPRHFGNTNKSQIQHALIEQIIQHYDKECMDELFHQRESLSAMDFGTTAIRAQYNHRLNTVKTIRPVTENRKQTVFPGYGYCKTCQKEGTPADFQMKGEVMPRCKECGGYDVSDLVQPQEVDIDEIIGAEEISEGDICLDLVNIAQLNWDMRVLTQESSWVHQRTEVSTNLARSLTGVDIHDEDPEFDDGLQMLNALGTRGGSVAGWGRENLHGNYETQKGVTILDEVWITPEWYAGRRFSKTEKTVSGVSVKKGQLYTDVFPDAMCLVGFNDMRVLAAVLPEKCRIKSSVYHIQSSSGIGKGTTDAVEISEHLNIAHSAAMAIIKRFAGGGGTWYDSDVMSATDAKNLMKPGGLVGIKMRGTPYSSVDQALKRIDAGSLDQGNLAMIAQLSNMLNIVFQTTDFASGVTDSRVDINTLGGQQLLQAQNQQRSAAPLRMKGYHRTGVFEDVLELFRMYIHIPRFYGTRDKYGLNKGRFLSGKDLPEIIRCDSVPDSELPTNRLTKRDNFEKMLTTTGQSGVSFFEIVQTSPRVAAWIAEEFQVDMPLFNYTEILVICQDRLDKVLKAAQMEEQIAELSGFFPDPAMIAEQIIDQMLPPITPAEDNLIIKAQVLSEYLDDDEVSKWTPLQTAAVQALIWRHYKNEANFKGNLAGLQQDVELGLQAKAMQAQTAMQAPMMKQQAQMQAQEAEAQTQAEVANRLIDQGAEEAKFEREQEAADNDAKRDDYMTEKEQAHELKMEKMRAQQRVKPKSNKTGEK
jgi:hypothetical protein